MPLPLVPIAGATLAAIVLARALRPVRIDQRGEDALDALDEGVGIARVRSREQTSASGRIRRIVHLGNRRFEIDAGVLARVRLRQVAQDA